MGMSDPIADMLTRIRNANHRKFKSTDVFFSKMNLSIAKVLKKTGYINGFEIKRDREYCEFISSILRRKRE
jgi:small subunit ribosomal protein S8